MQNAKSRRCGGAAVSVGRVTLVLVSAKQMTTYSLSCASEILDVFNGVKTNIIHVRFVAGQDIFSGKFSNSFTAGGYN